MTCLPINYLPITYLPITSQCEGSFGSHAKEVRPDTSGRIHHAESSRARCGFVVRRGFGRFHAKGTYLPTHDLPITYPSPTHDLPTCTSPTHQMPQAKLLQEAIESLWVDSQYSLVTELHVVAHLRNWINLSTVQDMFHNNWEPHVANHTLHFFFRAVSHCFFNEHRYRSTTYPSPTHHLPITYP